MPLAIIQVAQVIGFITQSPWVLPLPPAQKVPLICQTATNFGQTPVFFFNVWFMVKWCVKKQLGGSWNYEGLSCLWVGMMLGDILAWVCLRGMKYEVGSTSSTLKHIYYIYNIVVCAYPDVSSIGSCPQKETDIFRMVRVSFWWLRKLETLFFRSVFLGESFGATPRWCPDSCPMRHPLFISWSAFFWLLSLIHHFPLMGQG